MQVPTQTRRRFLQLTGLAGVTAVGTGSFAAETKNGWQTVESPTGRTLHNVVQTTEGPYAVGGGGGAVLARRADGWETVLDWGRRFNPTRFELLV